MHWDVRIALNENVQIGEGVHVQRQRDADLYLKKNKNINYIYIYICILINIQAIISQLVIQDVSMYIYMHNNAPGKWVTTKGHWKP